jgi:hypothetical protein
MCQNIRTGKGFLDKSSKTKAANERVEWDYIKLKKILHRKDSVELEDNLQMAKI